MNTSDVVQSTSTHASFYEKAIKLETFPVHLGRLEDRVGVDGDTEALRITLRRVVPKISKIPHRFSDFKG